MGSRQRVDTEPKLNRHALLNRRTNMNSASVITLLFILSPLALVFVGVLSPKYLQGKWMQLSQRSLRELM